MAEGAVVEFLVREGLADTLLAAHRDDGHGRCAVCSAGAQAAHAVWPCVLAGYATRAREVARAARCEGVAEPHLPR